MSTTAQIKHCPKCGLDKPTAEFYKQKKSKDGLQCYCKVCDRTAWAVNKAKHTGPDCTCPTCIAKRNLNAGLKKCPRCDVLVSIGDFTKNKSASNGFGVYCKRCAAEVTSRARVPALEAWNHDLHCDCPICTARRTAQDSLHRCSLCGIQKSADKFHVDWGSTRGVRSNCIDCCQSAQSREGRWRYRLRTYRMDRATFWSMYRAQNGQCRVCHTVIDEADMCIDHDHRCCPEKPIEVPTCGQCTRALLCRKCNTSAGMLNDDPELAHSLAMYLWNFEDVLNLNG